MTLKVSDSQSCWEESGMTSWWHHDDDIMTSSLCLPPNEHQMNEMKLNEMLTCSGLNLRVIFFSRLNKSSVFNRLILHIPSVGPLKVASFMSFSCCCRSNRLRSENPFGLKKYNHLAAIKIWTKSSLPSYFFQNSDVMSHMTCSSSQWLRSPLDISQTEQTLSTQLKHFEFTLWITELVSRDSWQWVSWPQVYIWNSTPNLTLSLVYLLASLL